MRLLADIPKVEDIDIVAHSRGTAVMTKALRELVIWGAPLKIAMKTGTLILAAPDLDTGVLQQRLVAERVAEVFEQINIYVNPNDGALKLASLVTNVSRVGSLQGADLRPAQLQNLPKEALVHFISFHFISFHFISFALSKQAGASGIHISARTQRCCQTLYSHCEPAPFAAAHCAHWSVVMTIFGCYSRIIR